MHERTRLEVWGDPIAHSRSPQLHRAAYAALGLDWTYERRRVTEAEAPAALDALGPEYRGLSLTMPLKTVAFAAASERNRAAELTGAVNTLLCEGARRRGFNTDVGGLVRALRESGVDALEEARIIGAGATATSALVALAEIGATAVDVVARRPEAVAPLRALGERLGVAITAVPLASAPLRTVTATIATLPGDAPIDPSTADALAESGGALMDVVYGHWPTALSSAWSRIDAPAASGLGMLLHQAVLQVRIFTSGDIDAALPDESAVVADMRSALVGG